MQETAFLQALREAYKHHMISKQQYRTILGQYLAGEHIGAMKGFHKVTKRIKER